MSVDESAPISLELPPPPAAGFTIGDAAHSIAELAYDISKRFKGFTTTDGLRAVEIAITSALQEKALALQGAIEEPSYPPIGGIDLDLLDTPPPADED